MLAIFVGHTVEQSAVERCIQVMERRQLVGYPVSLGAHAGRAVAVCRTGLGDARGAGAARALLEEYPVTAMVSARIASALPDEVAVGDLVLCERVYLHSGRRIVEPPAQADQRLLTLAQLAARESSMTYRLDNALTFRPADGEPFIKEDLPNTHSLGVVTTEDHALAEAATSAGVPFLPVRVALGHYCDGVPNGIELIAESGALCVRRVLRRLLRPVEVPAIWALYRSVRVGSRRLSEFVEAFLREWALEP